MCFTLCKMETVQKIVVVSSDNPAKLVTKLQPINLIDNYGLAVTSFSHAEICNIHQGNNKIHIKIHRGGTFLSNNLAEDFFAVKSIEIPKRRYTTTLQLMKQIKSSILTYYRDFDNFEIADIQTRAHFSKLINIEYNIEQNFMKIKSQGSNLSVTIQNCTIIAAKDSPWSLIGITDDISGKMELENQNISYELHSETAFLYINIVRNSYINGKLSRNLCALPLYNKAGGSYYEFKNPIYVPIVIKQFSDIVLEIRNMQGEYVPFENNINTVISLHLKRL